MVCHLKALQKRFQLNMTDSALLHENYVQTSNEQTKICDIRFPSIQPPTENPI